MPPQGESVGLAIEDSTLFARIIAKQPEAAIEDTFARFERNRKKRIDNAFEEADWRWDTVKDSGLMAGLMKEWLTFVFLWWTKDTRDENYAFDVREMELVE
jgi:salicylate hydroxylase